MRARLDHDIDLIGRSGLFNAQWYVAQYPDVKALGFDPLQHFVRIGALLQRNPGPDFNTKFYVSSNPDVAASGINPLVHYITVGHRENRDPMPGGAKPRITPPAPVALAKSAASQPAGLDAERQAITASGLFDAAWYAAEYTDIKRQNINPLRHFLKHGFRESRNPGPLFDTAWYKKNYGHDLSHPNPLLDYIQGGREKGRMPTPPITSGAWWDQLSSPLRNRADRMSVMPSAKKDATAFGAVTRRLERISTPPAIIIPVHNALDATRACIESVLRHTRLGYRLIIVDDASTDAGVRPMLETFKDIKQVELYFNEANRGFSGTINRGIELAGRSDVVFLNSDTIVTPNWLDNLKLAAYSTARTATATALSNNAGAFSVPSAGSNALPEHVSLDDYARAISQTSLRLYPTCPTGNGFCLYVRRDCLDETGLLDQEAFPRGYGEENDFCMRAMRKGWRHVIDDATLIYHTRSASFGAEKDELITKGRAIVDARYPDYTDEVRKFSRSAALKAVRARVTRLIDDLKYADVKPRALYVLSTRTGGTPQTNQDLMEALDDRFETFVLRCNASVITLIYFKDGNYTEFERHVLVTPLEPFPHRSTEYDAVVAEWLARYQIELVHIRHIAWHSLGLIEEAKALNLPVIFSFHDFYTACPNVKLLDENNVFCGGKCTATTGECVHELWHNPDFPPLKHASVHPWQDAFHQALAKCDAFVTTADFARDTIHATFPATTAGVFEVIPHGRNFSGMQTLAANYGDGGPLRILVAGNISTAKGGDVIHDLVEFAAQGGYEFHVIGQIFDKLTLLDAQNTPGLVLHGPYQREQFDDLVKTIRPHIGAVLSIWPETFCHTLTEMWSCGLPVIGFDTGAVGERLRASDAGWAVKDISAGAVRAVLNAIVTQPNILREKREAVTRWQANEGQRDCKAMAADYANLYASVQTTQRADSTSFPASVPYNFHTVVPAPPRPKPDTTPTPEVVSVPQKQAAAYDVDVVVPVYNALPFVQLCMASIQSHKDGLKVRTLIVNDGSQPDTSEWLRSYAAKTADVVLIEHEVNKGYTTAVNTGLKASAAPYVITLNSDTEVTRGWLTGMIRCMSSSPKLGIVGPLSNAASWQNVPDLYDETGAFAINEVPNGLTADDFAVVVAEASARAYPRTPFANGFCYMIRRAVLDTVGYMDQEAFPIGYGEENDYCIRAAAAGFELAYADDAYVFHAKSKSFGHSKRKELARAGSKALREKHGTEKVEAMIEQVKVTTAMDEVRSRIALHLAALDGRPVRSRNFSDISVLFLLPAKGAGGGVHSIVQEATEMLRLGVRINVAVNKPDVDFYIDLYNDIPSAAQLFIAIDEADITDVAGRYDVVIATIFTSVVLLERIYAANPHILPAYYVQDYEPWFFDRDHKLWPEARLSYERIPDAVCFAKTHWIARQVKLEHDVDVHKVLPSLDHEVYKPVAGTAPGVRTISAMIRPRTPRRGATRTMQLLKRLHERYGQRIDIRLFGCEDDDKLFKALERGFPYTNHGHLKRLGVADVLGRSDLFLDLSDYQAFGRTALEAMSCGCISLVPALGGGDEFAVNGENAIVVDTSDDEACFQAVCQVLDAPETIDHRKRLALKTAARFSIHSAAVSELTVFHEALEKRQRTGPRQELLVVPARTKRVKDVPGSLTGSAWVRLAAPYQQVAVQKIWKSHFVEDQILPDNTTAKTIIIQRDLPDSTPEAITAWAKSARDRGQRIVYEIDDDLLDAEGLISRGYNKDIDALKARVTALAQNADAVTVSTEPLKARFAPLNAHVHYIPNYLDQNLWRLAEDKAPTKPREGYVIKIGYIGTPSHDNDLAVVREAMLDVEKLYGARVEIEVIGGFQNIDPMFGKRVGLPKKNEYPDFVEWLFKVVDWDIGVIPLVDDGFNRAKSHLKFLEYSALGLASIVSNVPTYKDVVRDRENALSVANTRQAWKKALIELIENPDLRTQLANTAREQIRTQHCTRHHASLYQSVLKGQ